MSFDKHQLRDFISRTLWKVPKFHSPYAIELMMLTAAAESALGKYLVQEGGPALGMMQVEPATLRDNYGNYLHFRDRLKRNIGQACGVYEADEWQLECNMAYNVLMARLKYWRSPLPIPPSIEGMAKFHEDVYNAHDDNYIATGKKDWEITLDKYKHFCL